MNERQSRTLDMLRNLVDYLKDHRLETRAPLFTQMSHKLEDSVTQIHAAYHEQLQAQNLTGGRPLMHLKAQVRRKQMMPLARIARPLLKYSAAEAAVWKLPHARADAKTIGKQALAMSKALKPHRKLLAAAGFPKEFMTALERDAEQLIRGEARSSKGRALSSRATREMATQFRKAKEAIQVLDGLMMLHAPNEYNQWTIMTRLGKKIGRPRKPRRRSRSAPQPNMS